MSSTPFPLFPRVIGAPVLSRANSGPATFFNLIQNIRHSIILLRQSRSEVPENLPKSVDFTAFLELEAAIQAYGELACQAGKKHLSGTEAYDRQTDRNQAEDFLPPGSWPFPDPGKPTINLAGEKKGRIP